MAVLIFFLLFALVLLVIALKGPRTLHECLHPSLYKSAEFPEHRFAPSDLDDFQKKANRGYAVMKETSVIICGITRDDDDVLSLTIERIEKMGSRFKDYRVVLFENDSVDRTLEILRDWEKHNRKVTILSESLRENPVLFANRYERLAYCRNRYLDYVNRSQDTKSFEYVLVLDMDLTGGWSIDGVASSFGLSGWDAIASNSIGYHNLRKTYYDTLALEPRAILKKSLFLTIFGEGWQFRRNDPLIPLQSGFGGLCLYRRAALKSKSYRGTFQGRAECEHRALNEDGTLKVFLNPSQITVIGTQQPKSQMNAGVRKNKWRLIFLNW